jgi:hypothetical protein
LEEWAQKQTLDPNSMLGLLRETVDLKKLNGNLIKPGLMDDLIGDLYACIYEKEVPALVAHFAELENRERMRVDHILLAPPPPQAETDAAVTGSEAADQPTSRRTKTIGRLEVRRRAEALVAGFPSAPLIAKPKLLTSTETSSSATKRQTQRVLAMRGEPTSRDTGDSAANSVHDSADDESELSEIAEEEVDELEEILEEEVEEVEEVKPKPLFPNLLRVKEETQGPEIEETDEEMVEEGDSEVEIDIEIEAEAELTDVNANDNAKNGPEGESPDGEVVDYHSAQEE